MTPKAGDHDRRTLRWVIAVSCLVAALDVLIIQSALAPAFRGAGKFIRAAAYGLLASALTGATAWQLSRSLGPVSRTDRLVQSLRLTAISATFATAILLTTRKVSWAVVLTGLFAAMLGSLSLQASRELVVPDLRRIQSLTLGFLVQAALIVWILERFWISAALVGATCFALTSAWCARCGHAAGEHRGTRTAGHIVVAVALLIFGFYLVDQRGLKAPETNAADQSSGSAATVQSGGRPARDQEQLHAGILLRPDIEKHVTLVAPPLRTQRNRRLAMQAAPSSIPFAGEYAIYYWFMRGPPKNSLVTKGTPSEFRFSTMDRTPLKMEARQNLGRAVDVSCCSSIDLALWDEDPSPESVALEVLLLDSTTPTALPQSLGTSGVAPSSRHESRMSFPMPRRSSLKTFDEIRVIFHLSETRSNRSARIDIHRLYFVPRAL